MVGVANPAVPFGPGLLACLGQYLVVFVRIFCYFKTLSAPYSQGLFPGLGPTNLCISEEVKPASGPKTPGILTRFEWTQLLFWDHNDLVSALSAPVRGHQRALGLITI